MDGPREIDDEQAKRWNGPAAQAWIDAQDVVDRLFKPLETLLVDAVSDRAPRTVLDVGCGAGGTTLAVARFLGTAGSCTGIDISEPMVAAARMRAAQEGTPASFVLANAQVHAFEPAGYDMMISRFGVMFFNDPVAAFTNLRRGTRDEGELRFIVWRSPEDNPFMTTAERAAAPLLPNLPPRRPDAPGQFAFADAERVRATLRASGWADIELRPIDAPCTLPESELVRYVSRFGPVGLALQDADDDTRRRVIDTVRPAFESYVHGSDVRFTAACWMMCARLRA
jgi:SAM-dependent methyltransferase